jgi:hypothetical protein
MSHKLGMLPLVSDGECLVFFGTGPGQWPFFSRNGLNWESDSAEVRIHGADPGAVKLRDGSWPLLVTGPPRPGTPSAAQRQPQLPARKK